MHQVSLVPIFCLFAEWAFAVPVTPERRAVSSDLLATFNLMEQYTAAAYCSPNIDSPGTKVTCWAGNCPLVEVATTNTTSEFKDTAVADTTGFVALDETNSLIVVSFRGSVSIPNWIADFTFNTVESDLCPGGCDVHEGFWNSWLEARSIVVPSVNAAKAAHSDYQIVVVGHSLGGAVADLCAAELRNRGFNVALYTFGAPRVAPRELSSYISDQPGGNYRITHYNDPVPRLPPVLLGFVHISPEYYISTPNFIAVGENDIELYEGDVNWRGNDRWGLLFDVVSHAWYFNFLALCFPRDFQ